MDSNEAHSSSGRIAKNTLALYVRMFLTMIVGLYTSRVVLATLGVEDYGVYNVVGGLVSMFGLLSGSMSAATYRYIAFELGKGDKAFDGLQKVFSLSIQIYFIISIVTVLLIESIGLWFLYCKMDIPDGRLNAAFWVLQASVLTMVASVVSIPYNAEIIAHERMTAFAYISIVEAILKLAIAFVLKVSVVDKLILYAVMLAVAQLSIQLCYMVYCRRNFPETKYCKVKDWKLFKEMTSFAGWNMFGSLASISFNQGLSMLLNVFFGPVANAARAVSTQVQCGITVFITNFQTALNPQIIKNYAQKNFCAMHQLMFRSSKFSFFLMFMLSLPVLLEAPLVLQIWLKNVPTDSVDFLRLIICISLIYTIANPILTANNATGDVKAYYIVCGCLMISILPLSYFALKLGCPAYSVFIVHFCVEMVTQIVRLFMVRKRLMLSVWTYVKKVYFPIILVVVFSSMLPYYVCCQLDESISRLITVCILSVFSVGVCSFVLGFSCSERQFVFGLLRKVKNTYGKRKINKADCCGCSACVQRCPKRCIKMSEDEEGFLYPEVDETDCVKCGLCERVCPSINQSEPRGPISVYAAKNLDEEVRKNSSSGGIFSMLAERVIDNGGVVFGACFDEKWIVSHQYVDRKEDLAKIRGSKYVQSNIGNCYKEAERFLVDGRLVLFSGTPCQIAGLRQFLHKDFPNLLLVDVICHGVPGFTVFKKCIDEKIFKMLRDRGIQHPRIENAKIRQISFRDKRNGWKNFGFYLSFDYFVDGKARTFESYESKNENLFIRGFLANIYLRPSCYRCRHKEFASGSDITLGDYWGVDEIDADLDDDKGVSAITVNTSKGKQCLAAIGEISLRETTREELVSRNSAVSDSVVEPKARKQFFRDKRTDVSHKIERILKRQPIYKRLISRLVEGLF